MFAWLTSLLVAEVTPWAPPGGHPIKCLHRKMPKCGCAKCQALIAACVRCQKRIALDKKLEERRERRRAARKAAKRKRCPVCD